MSQVSLISINQQVKQCYFVKNSALKLKER